MEQKGPYQPIENYGIIGNQHTVALVNPRGSIDFMCFPRFDSPTIFAALLDHKRGGCFQIEPITGDVDCKQLYLPDTNVLLTRFLSEDGVGEITDFMPVWEKEENCMLIRKVTVVRGALKFKMHLSPRFNYARSGHNVSRRDGEVEFLNQDNKEVGFRLITSSEVEITQGDVHLDFTLKERENFYFVLESKSKSGYKEVYKNNLSEFVSRNFQSTMDYWKRWVGKSSYSGRWREMVYRSALTLKLLTSHRYGSTVAAPTFGLPELMKGTRNWDYRYTWIRDAAFTMYAFIRLGFTEEAGQFMEWIRQQFETNIGKGGTLQLIYGIGGNNILSEEELSHLEGYKNSKPVRIGNQAYAQFQLDIYGELMDCVYLYNKYGEPISFEFWEKMSRQIDFVAEHWHLKDHGIWEVRSEQKEFLFSRVMCWVAVDRAIRLAEERGFPYPRTKWRDARDAIYKDVYYNFWNEELQAFVQYKGGDVLDASALTMPLIRFISPKEPRFLATLEAIEQKLVSDSLVYRYNTKKAPDGVPGKEGTFSICTFWLVECLSRAGQVEKARLYFEKMLGYSNHLGLYSEQLGLRGEHLGNFPQAFTHLGLVSAAYELNFKLTQTKFEG